MHEKKADAADEKQVTLLKIISKVFDILAGVSQYLSHEVPYSKLQLSLKIYVNVSVDVLSSSCGTRCVARFPTHMSLFIAQTLSVW